MTAGARARDLLWSAYVWPKGRAGNRVQGAVIGAVESRRVRREWDRATRILLVHTPGKVGSKAMFAAIKASRRPDDALFHTHRINPDNLVGVERERANLAPRRTWYTADFLGKHLHAALEKPVVVLTAVRDPVERGLSAFLQNFERYSEGGRPITALSHTDVDDVGRQFAEHLTQRGVSRWMDIELNGMFGVDVFAAPFDAALGYQIEGHGGVRVGVIRHDRLTDSMTPFIVAMTGLHPPVVGRVNDSSMKSYAELHRLVRESVRLPDRLLDRLYNSVEVRHFFTPTERERAMARWGTGRSS